jgi:hypothetical protein
MINTTNLLSDDILDKNILEFVKEIKSIFDLSKRIDQSIISYLLATKDIKYLSLSQVINQKVLPKVFGNEYKEKLQQLLELCLKYNDELGLSETIVELNNLLKDDFLNYWKLT